MENSPDFICIGAQKSGTSWLYNNIRLHPDAAMPPEKEINFFYPPVAPVWKRKLLGHWLNADTEWFNRYRKWKAAKRRHTTGFPIDWYNHYLFSTRTLENYLKLFPKYNNKISGDISPSYVALKDQEIEMLAQHLPDTKIIYLLRNPIERAWSAFKMDNASLLKKTVTEADILKIIIQKHQGDIVCEHSRYYDFLDKWERYFPGRVNVWFYDQLCENPEGLFKEICQYLNIRPLQFKQGQLKNKIFEGIACPMPDSVGEYFKGKLKAETLALHARFKNAYTESWLDSMEKR